MAAAAAVTVAANSKSAEAAVRATDIFVAPVEAIHAKIKDAHAKIIHATLESSMQPTSEKVAAALEQLLPHEIVELVWDGGGGRDQGAPGGGVVCG
ncbi:hypothetical protein ZWY2020_028575 [Hordeum vulgare]|nr:hypothetical protein ZWY2020_028575 [Hordeum vulgare]